MFRVKMGLQDSGGNKREKQSENWDSLQELKIVDGHYPSLVKNSVNYKVAFIDNAKNILTTTISDEINEKMPDNNSKDIESEIKLEKIDETELVQQMGKLNVKEPNRKEVAESSELVLNDLKTKEPSQLGDKSIEKKATKLPELKVEEPTELKMNDQSLEIGLKLSELKLGNFSVLPQTTRRLPSVFEKLKIAEKVEREVPTCDDSDEEKEAIPERGKHESSPVHCRYDPLSRSSTPMSTSSWSSSGSKNCNNAPPDLTPKRLSSRMSGGTCTVIPNVLPAVSQNATTNRVQHSNLNHLSVGKIFQRNDMLPEQPNPISFPRTIPIFNNTLAISSPSNSSLTMNGTFQLLAPLSPAFSDEARMTSGMIRTPSMAELPTSETPLLVDNWIIDNSTFPSNGYREPRPDDESSLATNYLSLSPSSSYPSSPSPFPVNSPTSNDVVMNILNLRDSGKSENVYGSSSDDDVDDINLDEIAKMLDLPDPNNHNYDLDLTTDLIIDFNNNKNECKNDNEITKPPSIAPLVILLPVVSVQRNTEDNSQVRQRQNSGTVFRKIAPKPDTNSTSGTNANSTIQSNAIVNMPRISCSERLKSSLKRDLLNNAFMAVDMQPTTYFLSRDDNGDTPLHIVMNYSNEEIYAMVMKCKEHNISLNTVNAKTQTPIFCAVGITNSNPLVVGFLIEQGADPAHTCIDGTTPLHIVAKRGDTHAEIARILGKACKPDDFNKKRDGCTPLVYALKYCETTCVKIVEILLNHGAIMNDKTADGKDGRSALHLAVDKGDLELIKVICKTYPKINEVINSPSFNGETPLHVAAKLCSRCSEEQQMAIIKLLFENGAEQKEDRYKHYPRNIVAPNRLNVKKLLRPRR
ncbi:hypothetical protein CHUAL_012359 [Chamberlinius hualienensis]